MHRDHGGALRLLLHFLGPVEAEVDAASKSALAILVLGAAAEEPRRARLRAATWAVRKIAKIVLVLPVSVLPSALAAPSQPVAVVLFTFVAPEPLVTARVTRAPDVLARFNMLATVEHRSAAEDLEVHCLLELLEELHNHLADLLEPGFDLREGLL